MSGCYAENVTVETDPTHTLEVRENFAQDIRGRFRRVRGLIRRTAGYENDAFGIAQQAEDTGAYDFPTRREQINAFIEDLKTWIGAEILEPATFSQLRQGEHWTSEYVRAAYYIGHQGAVGRLNQEGVSAQVIQPDDLLSRPMRVKTLRDLYERTYQNLRGITDDMADIIRTELTEGFAAGENPRKIADRLTDKVSNLQKTRAETLARTEVINAHSEATLDEYENAGVDVVGHGDWQATQDTRTCPFCRRISGERFTLDELRGDTAVEFRGQVYRLSPPSHPNGRCAILPAVGFDGDLPPLSERVPGEIVS